MIEAITLVSVPTLYMVLCVAVGVYVLHRLRPRKGY